MNKDYTKYPLRKAIYISVMLFALLLTGCTNKTEKKVNESIEQETEVIEDKQTESNQEKSNADIDTVEETKGEENSKENNGVITYGEVEYEDTQIAFKTLEKKADNTKDKGTSGIISKGVNGISRKEIRKVYKDGKYSHNETVKDSYVFKAPVNHQEWYGTKEKKQGAVTYGKVEYEDTKIAFKTLEKKADNTKDKGTSGIISKGVNGISRKEVRKVYKDGKYSHKETVKDSYIFKAPVNHQEWYGTKVKDSLDKQVNEVVRLTNEERKKNNLSPLKVHSKVAGAANTRANEITKVFNHKRPDGSEITTLLTDVKYLMIGENIAYGYTTPADVVKGWMDSEGHRRNILKEEYTHIGVGLFEEHGTKYWVQLFMK